MNPHKKGTMEYLDYATAKHTKAMAPKKKKKKKMMGTKVNQNPPGLAAMSSEDRLMGSMNDLMGHKKKMKSIFKAR